MGSNKRWVSRFKGQEMRDGGRQGHLLRAGESRARAKGGKEMERKLEWETAGENEGGETLLNVDSLMPGYIDALINEPDAVEHVPQQLQQHDLQAQVEAPVLPQSTPSAQQLAKTSNNNSQQKQQGQVRKNSSRATEQNRQAQHRFRQRQKERISSLTAQVERLETRISELQGAEREKVELGQQAREASAKARELERENVALRDTLLTHNIDLPSLLDAHETIGQTPHSSHSSSTGYDQVLAEFSARIQRLRETLEMYPNDSREAEEAISSCVESALSACLHLTRLEGSGEMVAKSSDETTLTGAYKVGGQVSDREYWHSIAHEIGITPEQQQRLICEWRELRSSISAIFEERTQLNDKVKALYLEGDDGQGQRALAGNIHQCHLVDSVQKQDQALTHAVNELRANLQSEMRLIFDYEKRVLLGLLHPRQTGQLMCAFPPFLGNPCSLSSSLSTKRARIALYAPSHRLSVYPSHPNALALSTALNKTTEVHER